MPLAGEITGDIGGQRRLADAPLGIGDHDHRHGNTPLVLFRYGNGMDTALENAGPDGLAKTPAASPDIYVIAAHPDWRESHVNRPMMQAAATLPRVAVQDLYSSYPDYAINVAAEQAAMARAQLVVLLHPIQWYAMPALQKLWLDEVLTYGWAYGDGGSALRGKDLWLVASTGGDEASYHPQGYNRYFFDAFLPPYEQTAALCGMRFLPPLILHGATSACGRCAAPSSAGAAPRCWPALR
ncbi:MAG: NAD(P)H dehydrogenase [Polaromonas sp. 24-62-144]|nr:MAG: NAD(P)H dehydrogenase [Polaromonas sp. 24-62-144]